MRIALACGVTPMALYRHVDDKETLLTLIVDRVVGDAIADFGRSNLPWMADLIEFGCRYRAALLGHRVAAEVFLRRPVLSPNMARITEMTFEALQRAGFQGDAIAATGDAATLVLMGSVANDLSRPPHVRFELLDHLPDAARPVLTDQADAYSRRDGEQRFREAAEAMLTGYCTRYGVEP